MNSVRRLTCTLAAVFALITSVAMSGTAVALLPPPDPHGAVRPPQTPAPRVAGAADHTAMWALAASLVFLALIAFVTLIVAQPTRRQQRGASV